MIDIKVTDAACAYIKSRLAKDHAQYFRLSVKKTGCSGYSYFPSVVDNITPTDVTVEADAQLTIYVDASWLDMLTGLQIDYVEEDKNGLKQKRLVFTNPNESSRCGCGESFHIE